MNIEKFNWAAFDALYDEVSEIYKTNLNFENTNGKLIQLLSMAGNISTQEEYFADADHKKRLAVVRKIEGTVGEILEEMLLPHPTIIGA